MAENKLYYPAKIASNNPDSYGIIDATEISGFRVITTLAKLFALPISILSITKTGEDAVGQYWWVISEQCYFQLVNWNNRTTPLGWAKIVPKVMADSANDVDFNAERVQLKGGTEVNPKNINPITTTSNVYDENFLDRNLKLLSDILKDFDYRIDYATQAALTDGLLQGIATPSTIPSVQSGQKIAYLATQAGTYTNFKDKDNNALSLDRFQIGIFFFDGVAWQVTVLDVEQDRVFDGGRADTMYGGARTINCGNASNIV